MATEQDQPQNTGGNSGSRERSPSAGSPPDGFDPGRAVRRTLKPFATAPQDGKPFHILSTVRFNKYRGEYEILCWKDDGNRVWREHTALREGRATYWLRLAPLPYDIPTHQWFTVAYRVMVAKFTFRQRVMRFIRRAFAKLSPVSA